MRIVIAGAGDVGFHLAKLLALESQDITVIDTDEDKLEYVANHLDVDTILGSATSFQVLKNAGADRADLFIAVTSLQEVNFTTAVIAKQLGAIKTIVRVSSAEFIASKKDGSLQKIGIDEVIMPETLAAKEIKRLIQQNMLTDHFSFEYGKLSLMGIKVDEDNILAGKSIGDLVDPNACGKFRNVAVLRNNVTVIPDENTIFHKNDRAYFITQPEGEAYVKSLASEKEYAIKKIMILGGSKIGFHAAKTLSKQFSTKIIEADKKRCFELADRLPDTLVIHGNGTDIEFLEEENLNEMDAFIAVTDNTETNIISCLMAKNHGVKKTIALVENMDYIHLSQSVGVDTMINKRLIAANFIFRDIRKGDVLAMASIHGADCEILEFEVNPKEKIYNKSIEQVKFPEGAIIGGVIQNDISFIPKSDYVFKDKDHVVVLSKPECIRTVESFFQ